MNILRAEKKDLTSIMELIRKCVAAMNNNGIYQWNDSYPNKDIILEDIVKRELFIFKIDSNIAGIMVINEEQSPEYSEVLWSINSAKILVLHRLAVHPDFQREGVASALLNFAESTAKNEGYTAIRLDTYSKNPMALKLYEKHGYIKVGQVYFEGRKDPFYCYEKEVI